MIAIQKNGLNEGMPFGNLIEIGEDDFESIVEWFIKKKEIKNFVHGIRRTHEIQSRYES